MINIGLIASASTFSINIPKERSTPYHERVSLRARTPRRLIFQDGNTNMFYSMLAPTYWWRSHKVGQQYDSIVMRIATNRPHFACHYTFYFVAFFLHYFKILESFTTRAPTEHWIGMIAPIPPLSSEIPTTSIAYSFHNRTRFFKRFLFFINL